MTPCQCKSDNFVCHAADGCSCKRDFTGENCDIPMARNIVRVVESSSAGPIVGGIMLTILLIAIFGLVILYYRRRVDNLKTQISIHYTPDPEGSERHHFDNPVYSFGPTTRDDASSPLNNQIKNNLKSSNLEKQKKAYHPDDDDDDDLMRGSNFSKNRDADHTNPNLYDEDKPDHFYEELKGYKVPEETYDHLDYNRPGSSSKTHYHQMPNGFKTLASSDTSSYRSEGS